MIENLGFSLEKNSKQLNNIYLTITNILRISLNNIVSLRRKTEYNPLFSCETNVQDTQHSKREKKKHIAVTDIKILKYYEH